MAGETSSFAVLIGARGQKTLRVNREEETFNTVLVSRLEFINNLPSKQRIFRKYSAEDSPFFEGNFFIDSRERKSVCICKLRGSKEFIVRISFDKRFLSETLPTRGDPG